MDASGRQDDTTRTKICDPVEKVVDLFIYYTVKIRPSFLLSSLMFQCIFSLIYGDAYSERMMIVLR